MGEFTPNLNLYKPDPIEEVDVISQLNDNYDKLDTTYTGLQTEMTDFETDIQTQIDAISSVGAFVAYDPAFGNYGAGAGTNFVLGDGVATGEYYLDGNFVFFRVRMVKGTTTVLGSKQLGFKLPFASTPPDVWAEGTYIEQSTSTLALYHYPLKTKSVPTDVTNINMEVWATLPGGTIIQLTPFLTSTYEGSDIKFQYVEFHGSYRRA